MTQDQVFVPKTRSQLGLPPFDSSKEDLFGSSVSEEVMKELWDALGDSPIGATLGAAGYLVSGYLYHAALSCFSCKCHEIILLSSYSSQDGPCILSGMHQGKRGILLTVTVSSHAF